MINVKSLNARLLISFSFLSVLICLFFIRLTTLVMDSVEKNTLQQVVLVEATMLKKQFNQGKSLNMLQSNIADLYFSPEQLPINLKHPALGESDLPKFYQVERQIILQGKLTDSQPFWLAVNTEWIKEHQNVVKVLPVFLYSVFAGVILLSLLSSWYLAKLLSTPIVKLTSDVETTDLSKEEEAFYGSERVDEIGKLASSFQALYLKLQRVLKRERNFTRDVSHELRTPITLIKNTLLLHKEKPLTNDSKSLIEQASFELENTVEVLLALARQENLVFSNHLLRPLVEKSALTLYKIFPELIFEIDIDIDAKFQVYGNEFLINLLCQNLVNNGFYHGDSKGMVITLEDNKIVFKNKLGEEISPYYQGIGHGQYLVQRIAEQMSWTMETVETSSHYIVYVSPSSAV